MHYLIAEKQFYHTYTPCCESAEDGFCGQVDDDGNPQYTVCDKPDDYFYWDATNPTQAGWKAVMEQLQGPIKEFLDI
jgi:phospholipase/lecithinase/hemolysin